MNLTPFLCIMAELPDEVWSLIAAKMAAATPLAVVSRKFYAITVGVLDDIASSPDVDLPSALVGAVRKIRLNSLVIAQISCTEFNRGVYDVDLSDVTGFAGFDLRYDNKYNIQKSVGVIRKAASWMSYFARVQLSPLCLDYVISSCKLPGDYPQWIRDYAAEVRARVVEFGKNT